MTPKFTTIKGWVELTGMSRSGTYAALSRQNLRAVKQGDKTLIDVEHGLAWLASLPAATFRTPPQQVAA